MSEPRHDTGPQPLPLVALPASIINLKPSWAVHTNLHSNVIYVCIDAGIRIALC